MKDNKKNTKKGKIPPDQEVMDQMTMTPAEMAQMKVEIKKKKNQLTQTGSPMGRVYSRGK